MREILFRGKRIDNGEWVEGFYVHKPDVFLPGLDKTFIINYCYDPSLSSWFEIDPLTLGQFTGLTDKTGTRIFEGDIVYNKVFKATVKYIESNAGFYPFAVDVHTIYADELEVIGNIYDKQNGGD